MKMILFSLRKFWLFLTSVNYHELINDSQNFSQLPLKKKYNKNNLSQKPQKLNSKSKNPQKITKFKHFSFSCQTRPAP